MPTRAIAWMRTKDLMEGFKEILSSFDDLLIRRKRHICFGVSVLRDFRPKRSCKSGWLDFFYRNLGRPDVDLFSLSSYAG